MITTESIHEGNLYQLLLVDPRKRMALLDGRGAASRLPSVSISPTARLAEQITSIVFQRWALRVIVIDWLQGNKGSSCCAVLEILGYSPAPCHGLQSVPISQIPRDALAAGTLTAVYTMLDGRLSDRGAFSRFGWLEEAKLWIRNCVQDQTLEFTEVSQLNASASFALVRFGTTSGAHAYWLKAVGAPNEHEFATTSYLANCCSGYLPKVIGMRNDWKAWIMEEFGSSLHSSHSLCDFQKAVIRLAELQKELVGKADELLAAQFADHRMPALASHIDELIAYLEEAMGRQTSTKALVLSSARLREIGGLLHDACSAIDELAIPYSVMHSDISPGSILSNGESCVFTDWCEAYLGIPFISFEQLSVQAVRLASDQDEWARRLRATYVAEWRDLLSDGQIERSFLLTPLLSVFSYLLGRGDWIHGDRGKEPDVQSYSRSLARRMNKLANDQTMLEAL